MNAVEIEEAISALAEKPFDPAEFAYAFLEAFGNKATTIKRLRSSASNKSDIGGVLQTNHIHIKVCPEGQGIRKARPPVRRRGAGSRAVPRSAGGAGAARRRAPPILELRAFGATASGG